MESATGNSAGLDHRGGSQLVSKSALTLGGTKRQVTAVHDLESQASAMAYLERVSRR